MIYFAVFARQYLWFLTGHNRIAWIISVLLGLGLTSRFTFVTKPRDEVAGRGLGRLNLPFWLVVVLPLAFVYAMRVVFPDLSFDVLNYRIFHAERALRGFLFLPTDFFPTPAPYNPAPDMITGTLPACVGLPPRHHRKPAGHDLGGEDCRKTSATIHSKQLAARSAEYYSPCRLNIYSLK